MAVSSGKYYNDVKAGNVFIGSTAVAGTAFPISTGTAVTFGLWNTSSNKNAVLLGLTAGFTSGTIALGTLGLANQYCGFALATAAPLSAFTDGTPKNALIGSGNASSMRFTPSAATLTAGGTACWWSGASITAATGAQPVSNIAVDINGSVIVTPGQLVFVCGSVAQTGLFTMSLTWAEVPASVEGKAEAQAMTMQTQILTPYDGVRNVSVQLTGIADGLDQETNVTKVDMATLAASYQAQPRNVKITDMTWSISGPGTVILSWDNATVPVVFATLSGNGAGPFTYDPFGGLPNLGDEPNGNILLSTQGFESNSSYTVLLKMVKKYA